MNNILKKCTKYLKDDDYRFLVNNALGLNRFMSDEKFLKRIFKIKMGYDLDLNNPRTYNEKLQWLKLYDRNPEYTSMVDKYEAKEYAARIIGEKYIIPTLGIWDRFDDIDFNSLPNQFVLKCTHDSGGIIICKDKYKFDKEAAKKKINQYLRKNFYYKYREWPYKDIKPRILAEEYMEDNITAELRDYKFFVFDGKAKALFIATERFSEAETKFDFYDLDFHHLDLKNGHPNSEMILEKPKCFDEMVQISEKLAKDRPHLRVDLYEINGKVFFGELTFTHFSGLVPFVPEKWDYIFGRWLELPEKKRDVHA